MDRIDRLKSVLDQFADTQGWNEHSQIELLLSFLAHRFGADPTELQCYLRSFADQEA
jgi:hypothetical protein